jgi:hypothetical protein
MSRAAICAALTDRPLLGSVRATWLVRAAYPAWQSPKQAEQPAR